MENKDYKNKIYRSTNARYQKLWNKKNQSTQVADKKPIIFFMFITKSMSPIEKVVQSSFVAFLQAKLCFLKLLSKLALFGLKF